MAMRLMISSFKKKFPSVKNVTTEIVHTWWKQGCVATTDDVTKRRALVLVDARPDIEFQVSHIPGAIRIGHSDDIDDKQIQKAVQESDKHLPKTIVVYCSLGYRSSILAEKIEKALKGVESDMEIYNMEGGIFKWANEGAPMLDGCGSSTKYAHPFNYVFGKLLHHTLRKDALEKPEENEPKL